MTEDEQYKEFNRAAAKKLMFGTTSKYYTPGIEEFYVGFEFEILLGGKDGYYSKPKIWDCDTTASLARIKKHDLHEIRVKYLDQEDIESLGWRRDKMRAHQLNKQIYDKGNICMVHFAETRSIAIFTRDPSKCDIYSKFGADPIKVANIGIKNKSELIKILKQLEL